MKEVKNKIHRIMSPRLVLMLGTVSKDGKKNIIPISNITSVSTDPGMAIVAVYYQWETAKNLKSADGFTLSLPSKDQLELIWKMGAKYSGYKTQKEKTEEFKDELDLNFSAYGPVLKNALGWIECELVKLVEIKDGNHLMAIGKYTKAMVDPQWYTEQIVPIGTPKPLMQWEQNNFSTAEDVFSIDYFEGPHQ